MALLFSAFCAPLFAGPDVIASGLFKDKALLTIDGKPRVLRAGSTSPEGVKLLSSNSQQASILVEGQTITLHLSQRISSSFKKPKFSEVKIPRASNGHYFVAGAINGRSAKFMVDTGATVIAMNINEARRLGIDLRQAKPGMSSTAGGMVETFRVVLDKVSVGSVTLHSISASVINGDFPEQILLGNSFLSKVEMTEQAGVLVFRKKY
ncbi:MAG: TIGR02281 family clan AA aspartic protease [Gammaproteobacteria bacterium]|nr:TIGR02281 family clan AA aspartic protease [Gammaproteobacteria bacterium]MBQ0841109.1 TIGR02281 family clan AA aspartic protease [Gammaproteobacteria bacterium]